jgi:predicted nucleic acid-binding protein
VLYNANCRTEPETTATAGRDVRENDPVCAIRVYLDSCAIQRPLDTYDQTRVALDAEAVLGILALCATGRAELVSSEALQYEMQQSPWPARREHARAVLATAHAVVAVDLAVETRAQELVAVGFKPLDAVHLACAESAAVDYFCTCDDRLLRRAKQTGGIKVKAVSPMELIQEVES